jgi:hypothetical protein
MSINSQEANKSDSLVIDLTGSQGTPQITIDIANSPDESVQEIEPPTPKSVFNNNPAGQNYTQIHATSKPAAPPVLVSVASALQKLNIDIDNPPFIKRMGAMNRCELCEVSLHANDQFTAHLNGRKHHRKVLTYVEVESARASSTLIVENSILIIKANIY